MWTSVILSSAETENIRKLLYSVSDACCSCGLTGHFICERLPTVTVTVSVTYSHS